MNLKSSNHIVMCSLSHYFGAVVLFQKSGIYDLLPGTIIDDWLFDPCGYSMNGLLPDVGPISVLRVSDMA